MNIAWPIGGTMTRSTGSARAASRSTFKAVVRTVRLRGWRFIHAPAGERDLGAFRYRPDYSRHEWT